MDELVTLESVTATQRCTKGHEFDRFPTWLKLGDYLFCWKCLEEKLPALLIELGIGVREEEDER
jgi:hypothetical protein